MCRSFRHFAAALVLAAAPSILTAQQTLPSGAPRSISTLNSLVDSVVRTTLLDKGVSSASVVVTRGDEVLVQRAWGRADIAGNRAADPSTIFTIGSNSKQFTAALVLRLVDRGRLSLGDSIGRHLSGIRPEWRAITIEQLLNHTSGLQRSFVDRSRIEANLPGDSLLAQAARDTMFARPGTTFIYSNAGYMILGVLIEKLYGKSYAAVLRDEIAKPLGLTTLGWCGDVAPGAGATGYMGTSGGKPFPLHPSQSLGAAGVCSTAGDLAKWNRALHGGRVLSESSYRAMVTPRGAAISERYGFGVSVAPAPWGGPAITHGGQDVTGFTSEHGWYPADSLSVTILYNAYPRVAPGSTHTIAALALGRTAPERTVAAVTSSGDAAPPPTVTAPSRSQAAEPAAAESPATGITGDEARRRFVGEYQLGRGVFKVDFENGGFVLTAPSGEKIPLVHESGATYTFGSTASPNSVTFLADTNGRVVAFLARASGAPDRRLQKIR